MGLRLFILSRWIPKFIIRRELGKISENTTTALKTLVSKYAAQTISFPNQSQQSAKTIQEQRTAMAQTQTKLVEILEAAVGHDEAVKLGRDALFSVGQNLGEQARSSLGVGDNANDLSRAAKIMYRVLGIEFHLDWHDQSKATLIIDQCALAKQYSKLTCEVLSATDEGVVHGLQPKLTMKFEEYMTSGGRNCRAAIRLTTKRAED